MSMSFTMTEKIHTSVKIQHKKKSLNGLSLQVRIPKQDIAITRDKAVAMPPALNTHVKFCDKNHKFGLNY